MKILAGRSNLELTKLISAQLDLPLTKCSLLSFSDGECSVDIQESIRGEHCFIVQSTCSPVNDNLIELLLMTDALKRADALSVTAIIPYFGYSRQDRKAKPRQPISAKVVANMITTAGVDRVMSMDLHTGQLEGFFDIPTVHLNSKPVFLEHLLKHYGDKDLVFVSPDAGSMSRVARMVKSLTYPVAMIDKRRAGPNQIKSMDLVGDVKGKTAIILDDIVDTGGTLLKSAQLIKEKGARDVIGYVTHGIFSGSAKENLLGKDSPFTKIYVSNTIPYLDRPNDKLEILDMSYVFARVIKRVLSKGSVSTLFE